MARNISENQTPSRAVATRPAGAHLAGIGIPITLAGLTVASYPPR